MYSLVISGHVSSRKMLQEKGDKNNGDEQKLKISKKAHEYND